MLDTSRSAMKYQYQLNKQLADQNRNWQERMANTAHQREIKDLKAAGLNPVLSVTGGNGATTPSGSTASVSDGAGYFSALANLEAAQLNSAAMLGSAKYNYEASKYSADRSFDSVVYQTEHPTANTPTGFLGWLITQSVASLDKMNSAHNFKYDSNKTRASINRNRDYYEGKQNASYKKIASNKSAVRHRKTYSKKQGYTDIDELLRKLR